MVRLAGHLCATQVPELLEACAASGALEVDLSDLIRVDPAGIEALQRLRAGGIALVSVPGYIQLKLDASGPRPMESRAN